MRVETAIILVNWNGRADTVECLESLMRLESDAFRVIIIDNGSVDGSVEAFRQWAAAPEPATPDGPPWPMLPPRRRHQPSLEVLRPYAADLSRTNARIIVVDTSENLGFAGGCNLGMRIALTDPDTHYFWLLNNDTVVAPDSLVRLADRATSRPDHGLIGSALLYYHRPDIVQGLGGWMNVARGYSEHIDFGQPVAHMPTEAEVESRMSYVMGASMLVRRDVFEQTGGMSERYFLYFEEPDWARRLPPGVGQGVCLASRVYHKEGGSIGTSSTARPSDTSIYYLTVNVLRFYWRYERSRFPIVMARYAKYAFDHMLRRDMKGGQVMLRAFCDAILGRYRRGPYGRPEFWRSARKGNGRG